MLGVTLFGLLFTPVFYVAMCWVGRVGRRGEKAQTEVVPVPAE
jgi:hypothetical protein